MNERNINITQNVTVNGATVLQIFQNSTLDYTVTGTRPNGNDINVSGSKTLPQMLGDMTGAQRLAWLRYVMVLAARMAYLGDDN